MHKTIFIVSLLILFTSISYAQTDYIKIKSDHLKESNYLKMDDFYLTHYLYVDLFLRENLLPYASKEDVSTILGAIKKYVSVENPLEIEIEKPGDRNYKIKVVILKKEDGTELLIAFTNWSTKKRIFEKEIKFENDSYTRWYWLNGSKMTYRKDMSDKNESNLTNAYLANAYLFDELTENDSKIKNTIDDALEEKNLNVKDNVMANYVLLKYHVFQRDNDNVIKQVAYLNELFETNKSNYNLKRIKMDFNATKFQIELMK
jgi:hypothetical protein